MSIAPSHRVFGERGYLAAGTASGNVFLWQVRDRRLVKKLAGDSSAAALAFVPGDRLLAGGGRDMQFWDVGSGQRMLRVEVSRGPVRALVLNRAGDEMVVADCGHRVRILDMAALQGELKALRLELPGLNLR
jgi:WD40 repeat protein